ncbi:pwi domain mRNA processing protein [Botrytis cinerea]
MTSVDAKLLKSTKFPSEFNQKVDFQKVNLEVMKKWIAGKISDILGAEDDVVIELCFNLIEGSRYPDIKKLQISLTGFLDKDTPGFCKELWKLCLSAQASPQGVPKELLEAKKLELIQEKIQAEQAADDARRRREDGERRDREMHAIRDRERGDRGGRGRGGGDSWRGGRGDRDFDRSGGRGFDRRGPRYSRSPRGARDNRVYVLPPRSDTYVPATRDRRDERRRPSLSRSRSPTRSKSPSRSPSRRRSRSASESRSPSPRRRRSRSPERRNRGRGGRGRARSPERRPRRRSPSTSKSRSPPRKRRRASTESLSRSPPPKSRRYRRRNTSSRSRSRSSSPSLSRSPTPGREVPHPQVLVEKIDEAVAIRRRDSSKDEVRNGRNDNGKRQRSLQRYEPTSRRRRNSSSDVDDGRNKRADTEEKSDRGSPIRDVEANKTAGSAEPAQNLRKDPQKLSTELREKLLREKIKKMRTSSSTEHSITNANAH